jgi:hypothetical protein
MAHNFQRPSLPYANESLQNDNRYRLLTRSNNRPPTDLMLDTDFNYVIDGMRQLDIDIGSVAAGILPGADDPNNANFVPTTDGAGNISWTLISDINVQDSSISGSKLIPGTIGTIQIGDGSIISPLLATNSITEIKILDGAVTTNKILDLNVTTSKIADANVTTDKIADSNVTTSKILDGAVTTNKILDSNVTTSKILDSNVTTSKIADANITTSKILDSNVTTSKIADGAITLPKIAPNVLTPAAVKADQIAANSTTVYTNPAVQQYHPSALKFSCSFSSTSSANPPFEGYNATSVTKNSDGNWTINFAVPFTTTTYHVNVTVSLNNGNIAVAFVRSKTTNSVTIGASNLAGAASNPDFITVTGYGIQ